MENNGISYRKSISEFNFIHKKANDIKQIIEDEISKLKRSKDKIIVEITSCFKKERLRLNEEENKLKLELDNIVKEMENELEKFLKESNNILLSCDKILQSTKSYEMLNDKNDMVSLYYISEINKNNEKAKAFFNVPIKNIDISFRSIFNNLYFDEYYFSGIPVPKDIKVVKKEDKISITWNIGNIRTNNLNKLIKYFINIKIDGNEDMSTYTSFQTNFLLDKYDENKDYEIKIRASIDGSLGEWSEIEKFKIKEVKEEEIGLFSCIKNEKGNNFFGPGNIFQNPFNNNIQEKTVNTIFTKINHENDNQLSFPFFMKNEQENNDEKE